MHGHVFLMSTFNGNQVRMSLCCDKCAFTAVIFWPSMIFINLRLWLFKRQKLTAPYERPNYFRNLLHTASTEKIEPLNGGGVMLLVHKDIPHMPLTELDNSPESVCKLWLAGIDHLSMVIYQYRTTEMIY